MIHRSSECIHHRYSCANSCTTIPIVSNLSSAVAITTHYKWRANASVSLHLFSVLSLTCRITNGCVINGVLMVVVLLFRGDLHSGDSRGFSKGWRSVLLHCVQPIWVHEQHGLPHCHRRWVTHRTRAASIWRNFHLQFLWHHNEINAQNQGGLLLRTAAILQRWSLRAASQGAQRHSVSMELILAVKTRSKKIKTCKWFQCEESSMQICKRTSSCCALHSVGVKVWCNIS